MKKWIAVLVVVLSVGFFLSPAIVSADDDHVGPAPNAGDGIPDGSGLDSPSGQSELGSGDGPMGPAPNSGDCIPDGSGF